MKTKIPKIDVESHKNFYLFEARVTIQRFCSKLANFFQIFGIDLGRRPIENRKLEYRTTLSRYTCFPKTKFYRTPSTVSLNAASFLGGGVVKIGVKES